MDNCGIQDEKWIINVGIQDEKLITVVFRMKNG